MWIDTHCHLNHERITPSGSPADIAARARHAGVEGMVNISCTIRGDFPAVLKTAQDNEGVWCSVGTHPHDSGKEDEKAVTLADLVALAQSDPKIIGIGESGLDYHYDYSPRDDQAASFRKHIRACIETGLPLIVHAREADEDIIQILREEGAGTPLTGVMHSFSSSPQMARAALDMGFYLSFSGMVTFKKSTGLQDIAKSAPVDRLLVETDAPFLAPEPYRGKVNEPAYAVHTGQYLASLHNLDEETMARQLKENFFRLFTKARAT